MRKPITWRQQMPLTYEAAHDPQIQEMAAQHLSTLLARRYAEFNKRGFRWYVYPSPVRLHEPTDLFIRGMVLMTQQATFVPV